MHVRGGGRIGTERRIGARALLKATRTGYYVLFRIPIARPNHKQYHAEQSARHRSRVPRACQAYSMMLSEPGSVCCHSRVPCRRGKIALANDDDMCAQ